MVIEFLFFIYFGVIALKLRGGGFFFFFACSLVLFANCKLPVYRATFFVSMFIYQKKKNDDVARHVIIMALTCYAMWYFLIILLKVG